MGFDACKASDANDPLLPGISDRVPDYMDNLKTFIQQCMSEAQMIRESLYKNLESSFFFFNEYVDVPIVSDEQFAALEEYKMAVQDATQDIMKMGNAETFLYTDAKRNEMNDVVDVKSERLRRLTILACQATRGCGLYYASADCALPFFLLYSFDLSSPWLSFIATNYSVRVRKLAAVIPVPCVYA